MPALTNFLPISKPAFRLEPHDQPKAGRSAGDRTERGSNEQRKDRGLVAAGALATTGTALAASGGGPVGEVIGGGQDEFAKDLAGELEVSRSKVESALRDVAAKQRSEQTRAFAESLAAQLDGVNADQIVAILDEQQQKLEEEMKAADPAPKSGERPDPQDIPLVAALAKGSARAGPRSPPRSRRPARQRLPRTAGRCRRGHPRRGCPPRAGMPLPGGPGGIPGPGGPGTGT